MDVEPEVVFREGQEQKNNMKTSFLKTLLAGTVSALVIIPLFWSTPSQAAFVFGYGGATANQTGDYILGNNFVVNTPVAVTQLGVFSQDLPTSGSISISIYKNAGSSANWTRVPGTLQTVGSGALLDSANQTAYINIAPVTLGPGLYSVVTATSTDYNSQAQYEGASLVTFNDLSLGLTQGTYDIWASGATLGISLSGMQTTGPGTGYPWPLPVFGAGTLSVTAVPEPTTMIAGALLLLPFGASTLRILRKNRTA